MIEDKIAKLEEILGRKFRLAIVDDDPYNRYAIEQAVIDLGIVGKVDIVKSEEEAKEYFKKGKRPSYIITDLEMEDSFSGLYVTEEAFKHGIFPIIATGANLEVSATEVALHGGHGPTTTVIPGGTGISAKGRKSFPRVWRQLIETSLGYFTDTMIKEKVSPYGKKRIEFVEKMYNILYEKGSQEGWSEEKIQETLLDVTLGTFGIIYLDPLKKQITPESLRKNSFFYKLITSWKK